MKFRHPHIFGIFLDMARVLVLLLLPLVRGLLTSLEGGLQSWLASAWMDILVICLFWPSVFYPGGIPALN